MGSLEGGSDGILLILLASVSQHGEGTSWNAGKEEGRGGGFPGGVNSREECRLPDACITKKQYSYIWMVFHVNICSISDQVIFYRNA
jgi:hypothetical protein